MQRLTIILLTIIMLFFFAGCNYNTIDTANKEVVEQPIEEDTATPTQKVTNTPTPPPEETLNPTPSTQYEYITPLTDEEFSFNGLRTHFNPEKIKEILGEPINEETKYDELLGFDIIYYTYDDYYISFALDMYQTGASYDDARYIATTISIRTEDIACLRGVMIGDTLDEVLVKMRCDMLPPPNMNEEDLGNYDVEYFYGKNTDWQNSKAATVVYDGDKLIRFVFGHHIDGIKRGIVFEFTNNIVTEIYYSEEIGFC